MADGKLKFSQSAGTTALVFSAEEGGPSDLLFSQAAATNGNLVFQSGDAVEIPANDATLDATLPGLAFTCIAVPNADGELVATLPAMTCAALASYDSHTSRPTVGQSATYWQPGSETEFGIQHKHGATERLPSVGGVVWQDGRSCRVGVQARRSGRLLRSRTAESSAWQDAERAAVVGVGSSFQDSERRHIERGSRFQNGIKHRLLRSSRFQDGLRDRRRTVQSSYQKAGRLPARWFVERIQIGRDARSRWQLWWQNGKRPPPGAHPVDPPHPPMPTCYTPSPHLLFSGLAATDADLLFRCERGGIKEPVVVPVRRVYVVLNNVYLRRVSDNAEVPAFSLSLSLDTSSWSWGFDATLPLVAESLVDPSTNDGPVELSAVVNGTTFRVFAEDVSRTRAFGEASVKISGRGRNAMLAAPYAPVMTFGNAVERTAQQLMADVLMINGVSLGWSVDWALTDWLVPAGAFAHQGTWIEACAAIAKAAGGYLQPHPSAQTLRVRHRYPVAPWDWAATTPDLVLPSDVVSRESVKWIELPGYNRVFVSGQDVGVVGQVTRTGTAGDVLAQMVVDPLITHADAARQRGIAILGDTGRQIEMSLRLPVLAETGIVEPGTFIEYQDGSVSRIGMVRATQVQAGMPEVWQTLGVQMYA